MQGDGPNAAAGVRIGPRETAVRIFRHDLTHPYVETKG